LTRAQSIIEEPVLTNRFVEALGYAAELHLHQRRKGKGQPYVGHLLGVAAIVIQHGGGDGGVRGHADGQERDGDLGGGLGPVLLSF